MDLGVFEQKLQVKINKVTFQYLSNSNFKYCHRLGYPTMDH